MMLGKRALILFCIYFVIVYLLFTRNKINILSLERTNLMNWLNDTEAELDELARETGNDPERIKHRLAKHREFQRALSGKQSTYDSTMKAGKVKSFMLFMLTVKLESYFNYEIFIFISESQRKGAKD